MTLMILFIKYSVIRKLSTIVSLNQQISVAIQMPKQDAHLASGVQELGQLARPNPGIKAGGR